MPVFDKKLISFDLPNDLIPSYRKDWEFDVKLLVFTRKTGLIRMHKFADFPSIIGKELCYANNAKLDPACRHLFGHEPIYAQAGRTWAVPSAGLPITKEILERLNIQYVTLEAPRNGRLSEDDFYERGISNTEYYRFDMVPLVPSFAIGTTVVKSLETYAQDKLGLNQGYSDLLIIPGHKFKMVNGLLTNFHYPGEALLALVAAFVGIEQTMEIYRFALKSRLRFSDFGDRLMVN